MHVWAFRFVPSHCSPVSSCPLPHIVHPVVENEQFGLHDSVPPAKPCVTQVWAFRSAPSHFSPLSIWSVPSPHLPPVQTARLNVQSDLQVSVSVCS